IAGMTDPDADAVVVIADMFGDRTQPVMSSDAAADFQAHLARRQINLVVKHCDVPEREFVKMRGFGDRAAGFIHESAGQQQQRAPPAERSLAGDAGKAPAPWTEAVALGDFLNGEEADIVPVAGIARSRIAESDQEQHQHLSYAGRPHFFSGAAVAGAAAGAAPRAAPGAAPR